MTPFICTTCGTQFAPSAQPPAFCAICSEERQYVPASGQSWTTLAKLSDSHMPTFREEAGLVGIGTAPQFGIGQRALFVPAPRGNVLWDCISLVNGTMVRLLSGLGGLAAIAISHPHYYTAMVEWSRAFGNIPVYLHARDKEWVMRPDPCITYWEGDVHEIQPGLTLIRCGGHYDGGTVLHWAGGADGRGALLTGDILQVNADRTSVSFMRSYPNYIPLGAGAARKIGARVEPWPFEAVYGAFWTRVIPADGKAIVRMSVERHVRWLGQDII